MGRNDFKMSYISEANDCLHFFLFGMGQSPFYRQNGLECTTEVKQILMHTDPPPHTYATSHLLSYPDSFSETALRRTSPLKADNFQKNVPNR